MKSASFQDYMPGNVCFGCGQDNPDGLHIHSRWEGEVAVCNWMPEPKYWGWVNILNGGIMATLIDCHCMGAALAAAYRAENRGLDTEPVYRYATGTLTVKYLKPTPGDQEVELRASIIEQKGRKTTLTCECWSGGVLTATADVVALRVVDSSQAVEGNPFVG
ncbi:MAG: PaaI family thioesterase [Bacteroidia bacterium]|nr:PaaI family thioesterase [Bacteroidia bacterium]